VTTLASLCDDLDHTVYDSTPDEWHKRVQRIEAEFARVKVALEQERLR
jgi:hypothetical protein